METYPETDEHDICDMYQTSSRQLRTDLTVPSAHST